MINPLVKKQPAILLVNVLKCKKTIPRNPQKDMRSFSNRFSVLDVEDLLSDCDDNDETEDSSFTYERMTGGGEISNDEKTVSSETYTATSAERATENVTIEVITSIEEESSCDTRTTSSLERNKLDNRIAELCKLTESKGGESEHFPSVEKDLQELEIATRDTSSEDFTKDDCLDNSVLEVIHLLNNGKDKNCTSDTKPKCRNSEPEVRKVVKLFEGQTFSSYDELKKAYEI